MEGKKILIGWLEKPCNWCLGWVGVGNGPRRKIIKVFYWGFLLAFGKVLFALVTGGKGSGPIFWLVAMQFFLLGMGLSFGIVVFPAPRRRHF